MTKTEQDKILEDKINLNAAHFNLNRQAAIVSAFSDGDFDKYEYLMRIDLALKPNSLQKARFQYSPLGDLLNKNLKVEDKDDADEDVDDLLNRLDDFNRRYGVLAENAKEDADVLEEDAEEDADTSNQTNMPMPAVRRTDQINQTNMPMPMPRPPIPPVPSTRPKQNVQEYDLLEKIQRLAATIYGVYTNIMNKYAKSKISKDIRVPPGEIDYIFLASKVPDL